MTEFVKLEAAIQLTPRDYRVLLAQLAVQVLAAWNAKSEDDVWYSPRTCSEHASELLLQCGIEEAKVPAQHQQQLSDEATR